jgi:hypothetical protein
LYGYLHWFVGHQTAFNQRAKRSNERSEITLKGLNVNKSDIDIINKLQQVMRLNPKNDNQEFSLRPGKKASPKVWRTQQQADKQLATRWRTFFESAALPTEDFMPQRIDLPPQTRELF